MSDPPIGAGDRSLEALRGLRRAYAALSGALPWLDASVWEDDPPAFPGYARPSGLPGVTAAAADPAMAGRIGALRAEGRFDLLRFDPHVSGTIEALDPLLPEMVATRTPLVVLHTDLPLEQLAELAGRCPELSIIIESGPLKVLYSFAELLAGLAEHPHVYLCTYNLCNWLGIERISDAGPGDRLLFGTHSPRYAADAAMGPVAFAHLPWERRCDIAGNNLRRLLGRPEVHPREVGVPDIPPFIVDAHAHTGPPGRFPVPDEGFGPAGWLSFMDSCCLERLLVVPFQSLVDPAADPGALTADLRRAAPGRVGFFEVFDPRAAARVLPRIEASLTDPDCAGIKIHPSFHETEADDPAYQPIYALAERHDAPILTHSWDVSATNPAQYMSHPSRFRPHLARHPGVRLVLGHAGGRPRALDAVVALCRDFPGVSVDLAGDYYDSGLVDCLADRVGVSRILFGSDVNWIDPRCNLAPVLASQLSDEDALAVLRGDAMRVYGLRARGPGLRR